MWAANMLTKSSRIFERKAENETFGAEYSHRAWRDVANKRSVVSGRVVKESLMNPENAEPAVFMTIRLSSPEQTETVPLRSAAISAVWLSALDCTKVVGWSFPFAKRCCQDISESVTRAADTCGLRSRKKVTSSFPNSSMHPAEEVRARE